MKYKISSIASIISGGTPQKNVPEYWGGTIPWITIKDFNSKYVSSVTNYISKDGFNNSSVNLTKNNDILISARGTVGKLLMVKQGMTFNQSIYCIRPNKQLVIPDYLYYWLCKNIERIKKGVHGSVFDTITRKTFDLIEINLPSLQLQKEKSKKVKALDDKIELNQRVNANLLEVAKGVYLKTLASSDLVETRLKDFATITMGQSPSSKTYNENGVGMALLNGAADFRNGIHPSKWTTDAKRIVDKGAYIFGVRATIGLTTKVFNNYAIGRGTGSAVAKDTVNDEFLYFVLDDMFKYFTNTGSGSVYINISKSDFNNYIFRKPQVSDLQTFHQIVSPMMSKIYANKKENSVLNQLKEILLNRLF